MSTTFVNEIDNMPLYADRAEKDAAGNTISTTYATKAEIVNADWDATSGDPGFIENKPTIPDPLPDMTGHAGDVLTVNSGATGTEWTTPSSGGGDLPVFTNPLKNSVDNTEVGMNTRLMTQVNANLPYTMNNSRMHVFYHPWLDAVQSGNRTIRVYGSWPNYTPRWCVASNGSTTKYLEPISVTRNYISSYTTYKPDGTTVTRSGYYLDIPTPPRDVTKVDTSVFNVVGDWSSDTSVVTWYLGFWNGETFSWWDATTNESTTENSFSVSDMWTSKVWNGHGLAVNSYNGLYVTNPVPAAASADEGKVLGVSSGAIGWVEPSGGGGADWDATSGEPGYIANKPEIPAAQVQPDWDATSGLGEILNKPTIPAAQVQTDWDATSGMGQLLNKPDLSIYAESADLATVATTGDYGDLLNKPTIPAAQVQTDWDATSGMGAILNKPAETSVEAGTGIKITEPTSSTLRISTDETVLWSGSQDLTLAAEITLSETYKNFEFIRFECGRTSTKRCTMISTYDDGVHYQITLQDSQIESSGTLIIDTALVSLSDPVKPKVTGMGRKTFSSSTFTTSTNAPLNLLRVVGVNRVASN